MPKMQTEYPQEPILLEGQYTGILHECTEYQKDYGQGPITKVAWVFKINATDDDIDDDVEVGEDYDWGKVEAGEGEYVFEVACHTSLATSENSNFAKLNMPAWVGDDWDGDTDSLLGKEAVVDVGQFTRDKDGRISNGIDKVRVPGKQRGRPKKGEKKSVEAGDEPKEEVTIDESDFEDIPMD